MFIIGLPGLELTARCRQWLQHPLVSGVILFSRNYVSRDQLKALTTQISAIRSHFLIGVDQEGGRVQRFKEGFTQLPAAIEIGHVYDRCPEEGLKKAYEWGGTMARELSACGVNLCFAPVADIYRSESRVIATRAFHSDPVVIAQLTVEYLKGMQSEGVQGVAKHFPGHGSVLEDTHQEAVIDPRPFEMIRAFDLVPFQALIDAKIFGIMASHVVYSSVDDVPAGFSEHWLKIILKQKMGFEGLIFSDDLGMQAAVSVGQGGHRDTLKLAEQAGCDRILLCNDFEVIERALS